MPSRFSSAGSLDDAVALAANLGIDYDHRADRGSPPCAAGDARARLDSGDPSVGLAGENLQARIRGIILMAISNERGWLVLTTGNKSEMAVGYATLYGDMAGGYAVLKDVPKTLVYELVRVPQRISPAATSSRGRSSTSRPRPSCARTSATTRAFRPTRSWTRSSRATWSGTSPSRTSSRLASTRRRCAGDRPRRPRRVQAAPGPARAAGDEPRVRQGPADADHEPVPGFGGHRGCECTWRSFESLNLLDTRGGSERSAPSSWLAFGVWASERRRLTPASCARWAPRRALGRTPGGPRSSRACFRSRSGSPDWEELTVVPETVPSATSSHVPCPSPPVPLGFSPRAGDQRHSTRQRSCFF